MSQCAKAYNVCGLRPRLDRFAHAMEAVLRQHDRTKAGWWQGSPNPRTWLTYLRAEVDELAGALDGERYGEALQECCDVANFAMMCFDAIVELTDGDAGMERVGPVRDS